MSAESAETLEQLPFLTADLPGTGGAIKTRPEDFRVEEVPLYHAGGSGEHVYVQIEKRSMTTFDAVTQIAKSLSVPRGNIGYAGLKDARAITVQWISVEHADLDTVRALNIPKLRIRQVCRHGNKLKIGHLAGNRFGIRIRRTECAVGEAAERARAILEVLVRRGVPNYFGPQRFGSRYDSHLLGAAIACGNYEQFIDMLLGLPDSEHDQSSIYVARCHYERADYQKAHDAWPRYCHDQRRALRCLLGRRDKKCAYNVIGRDLKRFYVSALQSHLFNKVVAARMPDIDRLLLGDMACKHDNGACFRVLDPQREQVRCDAFEVSPTGPLLGPRMVEATGPAGAIENPVIAEYPLSRDELAQMRAYRVRGARRAVRFQPRDVRVSTGADDLGDYLQICFQLDPGCYATTLLREVTKNPSLS